MKIGKLILILIFQILFFSPACNEGEKIDFKNINKILIRNYGEKLKQKSFLIVIPQSGCPSCIDRAINFIKSNIEDNSLFGVVLTNVTDKKYFTFMIGQDLLSNGDFLFDKKNEIGRACHIYIYPIILFLNKGKVSSIVEVSPEKKDIWEKLLDDGKKNKKE
jgi:hypothetical protein